MSDINTYFEQALDYQIQHDTLGQPGAFSELQLQTIVIALMFQLADIQKELAEDAV